MEVEEGGWYLRPHYHGGGFIVPLTAGWEYMAWEDAQTFNAIVFAVDYWLLWFAKKQSRKAL